MKRGYTTLNLGTSYEDDVKLWFRRIDRGIRKRKDQESRWDANEAVLDMRQWYNGKEWVEGEGDEPTVNKADSYMRTYRAAIAYDNPMPKYIPKNTAALSMITLPVLSQDGTPQFDEMGQPKTIKMTRAEAREALVRDIVSQPQFGLADTISRITNAAGTGYGVIEVGYSPQFGTPLKKDTDDRIPQNEDGTLDFSGFVTHPLTGLPVEDDDGNLVRKNQMPVWEEWFMDWVHYRDVIIDPDGGNDFMKHRWVAIEQIRTLEEVKEDPLFENTDDLEGTLVASDDDRERPSSYSKWYDDHEDPEHDLVRLFWIYDFVRDRRIVLADGHGEALLDEEMPLGINHSPLAFFRPNERVCMEEEFYPRPLLTSILPLIIENNIARRMLHLGDKRGIRKVLVKKGLLDDESLAALTNDEDMAVVTYDSNQLGGSDLAQSFMMIKSPDIGGDRYNHLNIISSDISEIGGMSVVARGGSSNDTATESSQREAYATTRWDFDRKRLRDTLIIAYKKLDDSIDANMTQPRAVAISGEAGLMQQVVIDKYMIECDCDITIDIEDMTPGDDAGDAARSLQFMQIVGQNQWMALDEDVLRGFARKLRIHDEPLIKGLQKAAMQQMQLQMMEATQKSQPASQEAGTPQTAGEAQMQNGAGTQVPRQSGSR